MSLLEPRYDQSTYTGRLQHFFDITNPLNLFNSQETLEKAKMKVLDYENSSKKGLITEDLWTASKLYKSNFHPDTQELIFAPFRMSSFVLTNFPVILGMMMPNPSVKGIIFWQWLNQSVNVGFNYHNANKSTILTTNEILTAYCAAVATSVGVALSLNALHKTGKLPASLGKFVPFIAVATAGTANLCLMRQKEVQDGITVYKDNKAIGKSQVAAKYAIGQTAFSRVIAAMPSMVIPPIIMGYVHAKPMTTRLVHAGLIGTCMGIGLPLAISLFDQKASIKGSSLEPQFQLFDKLTFNRGL